MLDKWELIKETVESSRLNKKSKGKVLFQLDKTLGENLILDKLPLITTGLDEEEEMVYSDIINALNMTNTEWADKMQKFGDIVSEIEAYLRMNLDQADTIGGQLDKLRESYENQNWDVFNKIADELKKLMK